MLATKSTSSIVASLPKAVLTGSDNSSITPKEEADWQKWQELIDYKLIEWGRNPGELEDDGLEPPTAEVISCAITFALELQKQGLPAPTNVVPDANGGIVFRRRKNDVTEEFHFWDDQTFEYCRFHGARMVERQTLG